MAVMVVMVVIGIPGRHIWVAAGHFYKNFTIRDLLQQSLESLLGV